MSTLRKNAPIQDYWGEPDSNYRGAQFKELPGGRAFFHWHCDTPMRKVVSYIRYPDGNIRKIGFECWVCEVCDTREVPPPESI